MKPIVYHLGRAGEVAGGMTQVVNGYLKWPFERVEVRVIVSRGDPGDTIRSITRSFAALAAVLRLRRRDQQVLVAHLSEGGSFLREGTIARIAHVRGIPTIIHLHGSSFAEFAERKPRLVRRVLAAGDRIISLSTESSEVCARFVDPGRVTLIPNAIESGHPVAKTRTLVFGGVVSYRKGIDVLQAAWERVKPRRAGWKLLVAGPIRDEHLVRNDLDGAEFLGSLDHDALMNLLDSASVAVLPSREEAMPMFILEALARRCAVVSTNVGGIAAVLADGAGVVLPPGDVDALTDSLMELLGDDAKRDEIAGSGRRVFEERFSAAAVFPRIESLWCETMQPLDRQRVGAP
jgi:glycosyltransferase involved in cell wall biosynthesis